MSPLSAPLNTPLSKLQRTNFLQTCGWGGAVETQIGEDWSQRKFFRVSRNRQTAILMQALPDSDPRATPGHKLRDFVRISEYFIRIGLSTPLVYAQDLDLGFLLVEDFGDQDFAGLISQSKERERDHYLLATDTLMHLYSKTEFVAIDLPDYYATHVHKGHRRVVDWYVPAVLERTNPDEMMSGYLAVWQKIEKNLPQIRRRLLHGDFHPANLMWLPVRQGVQQTGLIDFQGAMMGPAPYDLVNLLEDARREVPVDIRTECLSRFTKVMGKDDRESFLAWYPVLATQFHCRVIGQALRLAIRDQKTRLLDIIPILRHHLLRDMKSPELEPLKAWFDHCGIDFSKETVFDPDRISGYIRSDAY